MIDTQLLLLISRHPVPASHLLLLDLLMLLHLSLRLGMLLLSQLTQIPEPGVLEGVFGADAHLWSELQHSPQEIESLLVDLWEYRSEVLCGINVEVGLVFWEL